MALIDVLGIGPPSGAGDRVGAIGYLAAIDHALANFRGRGWSKSTRTALYRLRKLWMKRISGLDPRWSRMGIRPGRPRLGRKAPRNLHTRVTDEELADPLLNYFIDAEARYGRLATTHNLDPDKDDD